MSIHQQNEDGTWSEATPLPWMGWKAKTENWLRQRGFRRLPNFLAWWDERGL